MRLKNECPAHPLSLVVFWITSLVLLISIQNCQSNAPSLQNIPVNSAYHQKSPTYKDSLRMIYIDMEERYWLQHKNGQILYHRSGDFHKVSSMSQDNFPWILRMEQDTLGILYFDTPKGVYRFDGNEFSLLEVVVSDSFLVARNNLKDLLWFSMGTGGEGPFLLDEKKLYRFKFPKSPLEDKFYQRYPQAAYNPYGIYKIYKDRDGNAWFGTAEMGLYRYNGQEFCWMYENYLTQTPQGGSFGIRSILQDRMGSFWVCNGMNRFLIKQEINRNELTCHLEYKSLAGINHPRIAQLYFMDMIQDLQDRIWMLTHNQGVWCYDGKNITQYAVSVDNEMVSLSSLLLGRSGRIWVNSLDHGVFIWNGTTFIPFLWEG